MNIKEQSPKETRKFQNFEHASPAKARKALTLQACHVSHLRRNLARETVHVQIQVTELAQVAYLPRNLSPQGVVVKIKASQVGEPSNGRREPTSEPSSLQRNVGDEALVVATDALEEPIAGVAIDGP